MNNHCKLKFIKVSIIAAATALIGHNAFAHTTLDVSTIPENIRTGNNIVIGHGCEERDVIGTSVVFPDGLDSTITVDGQPHAGALTDFVQNWTNMNQQVYSKAVFDFQGEKLDPSGENVVGFWAGGGNSLPTALAGYVPFRTGAVIIEPTSCAASVKFHIPVVNVCEITPTSGFNDQTVSLWTLAGLGTPYDRPDDAAATLTITRISALPASCGTTGTAVEVKPSAAQINRDMPIKMDGTQIWPQ